VVSGFRVSAAGTGPAGAPLSAGTYRVTTADAWSWVQIPVRGYGWMVVDPTPATYSDAQRPQSVGARPSQVQTATPTQNALVTPANGGHAVAPPSSVTHPRGPGTVATILLVLLALALASALAIALLVLRKRLRRHRRRRALDPRTRLLGAWHETLDVLAESGLPDFTALTSAEISTRTGAQFGPDSARQAEQLGQAANAALFSSRALIGPGEADAAWRDHTVLRTLVRRQLSLPQRAAAELRYRHAHVSRPVAGPPSWASTAAAAREFHEGAARPLRRRRH
jgi:hypothetical protein